MKMTNEKRQVLITECHQRIKELEGLDGRRGGISKRAELQLDINRIALAALSAEPVAWRHDDGPFAKIAMTRSANVAQNWINNGWKVTPLVESSIDNTAQQYEALAGWQMVPIEPTDEMLAAGDEFMDGLSELGRAYSAMVEAAPKLEGEHG